VVVIYLVCGLAARIASAHRRRLPGPEPTTAGPLPVS
jgi:hypothetical protein